MSSVVRRVFGRKEEGESSLPASPPADTFVKELVGRPSHHQPIIPS
jgi:hypothetical protein